MTFQVSKEDGLYYRQTLFDQARRVVIKVGSAVLTGEDGLLPEVITNIARQIAFLQSTGREVILVTSGAVAAGAVQELMRRLIAEEDSSKPLSDAGLAAALREKGVNIARRTVAKYREQMKKLPASLRRGI